MGGDRRERDTWLWLAGPHAHDAKATVLGDLRIHATTPRVADWPVTDAIALGATDSLKPLLRALADAVTVVGSTVVLELSTCGTVGDVRRGAHCSPRVHPLTRAVPSSATHGATFACQQSRSRGYLARREAFTRLLNTDTVTTTP